MNFGDILQELRKDHNLKQRDVANALKVSVSTISHYESGNSMPDLEALIFFANFFGVSTDYLLGRTRSSIDYSTFCRTVRLRDGSTTSLEEVMNHVINLSEQSQTDIVRLINLYKLSDDLRHMKMQKIRDKKDTLKGGEQE
jgi:transcriptional regulator with XRE-family HTH domain